MRIKLEQISERFKPVPLQRITVLQRLTASAKPNVRCIEKFFLLTQFREFVFK